MKKNNRILLLLLAGMLSFSQVGSVYAFDDFSSADAAEIENYTDPFGTDSFEGEADLSVSEEESNGEASEAAETDSEESTEPVEAGAEEQEEIEEPVESGAEETEEIAEPAEVVFGDIVEGELENFTSVTEDEESDFAQAEANDTETTIVVEVTDGEDIGKKVADALVTAGLQATDEAPYTVKVPAGNYKLGSVLHIYSNTTLDCRGVTLTCTIPDVGNMIMSGTKGAWDGESNFNESKKAGGYLGLKNIKVLGGTWIGNMDNSSVIFRMAHATNVTWEGCTLVGCGGAHQAEVCAMDGFYLTNCTFRDFSKPDSVYANYEAIQLDNPCSTITFMEFYLDGLPSKNIFITGCTFSNVPRGLGTHTVLRGAYSENVTISNNVFENIRKEAIVCLNMVNTRIQNNQIINCGGGVLFSNGVDRVRNNFTTIFDGTQVYGGSIVHNANSVISGNTISIVDSAGMKKSKTASNAIALYGVNRKEAAICRDDGQLVPENLYYSGIRVENNTITTSGYGIMVSNIRNSTIKGNQIISKNSKSDEFDGIKLDMESNNIDLISNQIQNFPHIGIFVTRTGTYGAASAGTISGNQISKSKRHGICVYNGAAVTGNITGNTVSGSSKCGIYATKKAKLSGITSNTITSSGSYSCVVSNNSVFSSITKNNIKSGNSSALYISGLYQDAVISGNTFSISKKANTVVLDPATTAYMITLKNNILQGNKQKTGYYLKSGKYKITGNQVSNVLKGFQIEKGVKASIYHLYKIDIKASSRVYANGYKSPNIKNQSSLNLSSVKSKKKKQINVTWKKRSGATGVYVVYSTTKDFSSGTVIKKIPGSVESLNITGLKSGQTYYVRARVYTTRGGVTAYSNYGKTIAVKVK